jgi:radical SAM protein with 4Fe4S-binding SPASM domain
MKIKVIKADFDGTKWASFRLTRRCNNNCLHCCINLPFNSRIKELSVKNWCKIIDQLVENDIYFLGLTGGEITAYSGFKEVYMYAKRKGLNINLLTNATCFDKKTKIMLIDYPPIKVQVTIYGVDKETYFTVTGNKNGWNEFIKNIEFFKKLRENKGVLLEFTSIFTKDTIKFYEKMNEFSLKHTGKEPLYSNFLFSRLDKNQERNKMIEEKRLGIAEQKMVIEKFQNKEDTCEDLSSEKEELHEELFACRVKKEENINFFEDGTMTFCSLITDEKYSLKLNENEIENFDYKEEKEKLQEKFKPLLSLRINEQCAKCNLRNNCFSCPAKNLIEGIPIEGFNQRVCSKKN